MFICLVTNRMPVKERFISSNGKIKTLKGNYMFILSNWSFIIRQKGYIILLCFKSVKNAMLTRNLSQYFASFLFYPLYIHTFLLYVSQSFVTCANNNISKTHVPFKFTLSIFTISISLHLPSSHKFYVSVNSSSYIFCPPL